MTSKMKNKAVAIVKQIIKAVSETAKAKTMEVRRKTRAFKTRLIIFTLLQNRKTVMGSISRKLKGLLGQAQFHSHPKKLKRREEGEAEEERQGMVVYNHNHNQSATVIPPPAATPTYTEYDIEEEEEEEYPDLRHSMFKEGEGTASVIEMVKSSKEGNGEEFRLEDDIDAVADLYIKRFHRQMWIQKHLSFDHPQQHLLPSTPT